MTTLIDQRSRSPLFRLPLLILLAACVLATTGCKPDLTSEEGIQFGARHVPWNGELVLTPQDASGFSNGRCAFDIEYDMANVGTVPATPAFWNRLRAGSGVVTQQSNLTLAAGEERIIETGGYLSPGRHTLTLTLDDEGEVAEADESNNAFTVSVELQGPCAALLAELAISSGNTLMIVDPTTGEVRETIGRYQEVGDLVYRPDDGSLAVSLCSGDRIVELETGGYTETAVVSEHDSCAWDLAYSPDGGSLAATVPTRRGDPLGAMFGDLRVAGADAIVKEDLGRPLPAVAYRSDGATLVVAAPDGLHVLAVAEGYRTLQTVDLPNVRDLAFSVDGNRLLVGLEGGLAVLDAAGGYQILSLDQLGEVIDLAVETSGEWIAVVRRSRVSIHRAADLVETASFAGQSFRDADFTAGGGLLALAEGGSERVRILERQSTTPPTWIEARSVATDHGLISVAFR